MVCNASPTPWAVLFVWGSKQVIPKKDRSQHDKCRRYSCSPLLFHSISPSPVGPIGHGSTLWHLMSDFSLRRPSPSCAGRWETRWQDSDRRVNDTRVHGMMISERRYARYYTSCLLSHLSVTAVGVTMPSAFRAPVNRLDSLLLGSFTTLSECPLELRPQ